MKNKQENKNVFGGLSMGLAITSLFLLPPLTALAGLICGVIGLSRQEESKLALAGTILSIPFGIIGMILGSALWLILGL